MYNADECLDLEEFSLASAMRFPDKIKGKNGVKRKRKYRY